MPKDLRKFLGVGTVGALLAVASPAAAGMFEDWDTDGQAGISEDEWESGLGHNDAFERWDADGDGALSEDEFNAGSYDSYDADQDGLLDENEFAEFEEEERGFWDL